MNYKRVISTAAALVGVAFIFIVFLLPPLFSMSGMSDPYITICKVYGFGMIVLLLYFTYVFFAEMFKR